MNSTNYNSTKFLNGSLDGRAHVVCVAFFTSLLLSACGGGGGGTAAVQEASANSAGVSMQGVSDNGLITQSGSNTTGEISGDTVTGEQPLANTAGTTSGSTGDLTTAGAGTAGSTDASDGEGTADTDAGTDGSSTSGETVGSTDNVSQNTTNTFFFFELGKPAPGAPSEDQLFGSSREIRIDRSGKLVFFSRLESGGIRGGNALWGGSVFNPQLLLKPLDGLDRFPASVRVSAVENAILPEKGGVAAIVSMTGSTDEQALVLFSDEEAPKTVARTAEDVTVDGNTLSFISLDAVHVEDNVVAFSGEYERFQSVLMVSSDGVIAVIAPEAASRNQDALDIAPTLADGCKILFVPGDQFGLGPSPFAVASDGSVVFDSISTVDDTAVSDRTICARRFRYLDPNDDFSTRRIDDRFESVVRYTSDGEYQRIVTKGDPVPDMDAVFNRVTFRRMLNDGSVLVDAELFSLTNSATEDSLWLFDTNNSGRLIAIDDETYESLSGERTLDVSRFASSLFFGSPDHLIIEEIENPSSTNQQSWILNGAPRTDQPYANLDSLGAANFSLIVEQGSAAPAEYPDTAFFSQVGAATAKSNGGGFFIGTVADSASGGAVLDRGVWEFDANGEISAVLLTSTIVTFNEIPRQFEQINGITFGSGVVAVGDDAIVFSQSELGSAKYVYYPIPR